MQAPAILPFSFDEVVVSGDDARVLVMTPAQPMVLDRARRDRLRGDPGLNEVDRLIIERVEQRTPGTGIILMRGANDEGGSLWQYDPSLTDEEMEEVGRLLIRALLPFHRRLLARGISSMVHSDWGVRELQTMRAAVALLGKERAAMRTREPSTLHADAYILRHMLLFSSLSMQHVIDKLLPPHLDMLSRRAARVQSVLQKVPAEELA